MASSSTSKAPVKLGLAAKKIDSPLAKYNSAGQLTCIICNTVIKSEMVWTAHINGKQHRDQVAALKKPTQSKDDVHFAKPHSAQSVPAVKRKGVVLKGDSETAPSPSKKGIPADFFDKQPTPVPVKAAPKPIKSILKNAPKNVPYTLPTVETPKMEDTAMEIDIPVESQEKRINNATSEITTSSSELPEGFFDDPKLDAKVRQIEFKDPVEEEWDKFQKEIHDEVLVSTAIQEEDQEESTAERQLEEIEEQMMNWDRVMQLEQKKEAVIQKLQTIRSAAPANHDSSSSEDESDLNELFDWRSKAT